MTAFTDTNRTWYVLQGQLARYSPEFGKASETWIDIISYQYHELQPAAEDRQTILENYRKLDSNPEDRVYGDWRWVKRTEVPA